MQRYLKREKRFNRYMVECEFSIGFFCDNKSDGFNRYMVECELTVDNTPFIMFFIVLIDTWWNVNKDKGKKKVGIKKF